MDIVDIISKYKKQSEALPPIDGNFHNVVPSPPSHRHKPKTPSKKINLIQHPLYFVKTNDKLLPDHRKYVLFKNLFAELIVSQLDLNAKDFAQGDCAAPSIDCWPLNCRTNKDDGVNNNRKQPTRPEKIQAKPLLLQQLESFLAKELSIVGSVSEDTLCEGNTQARLARLQVYRECFLLLIEDFKTYQPLLLRIKAEYEALIDIYTMKVSKIPQYEATIRTMEQEAQNVISERNLVNKMKVKTLKKQLKATQAMLTSYAATNATYEDTKTKLTEELEEQTKKLNDVMATNQMLVHSMKRQDERQKQHDSQVNTKLIFMLHNSTFQLSELHGTLQSITTKYSRAQEEISELRSSISMLEEKAGGVDVSADKATINHLTHEIQDLLHIKSLYDKSLQQPKLGVTDDESISFGIQAIQSRKLDINDIFGNDGVPTSVNIFIEGLIDCISRKKTLSTPSVFMTQTQPEETFEQVEKTNEIVDSGEVLMGKGMEDIIPDYLRFDGFVRNLYYSKRDAERWINDIWQQKDMAEKLTLHGNNIATARKKAIVPAGGHHASFLISQAHSYQIFIPLRQYFPTYLNKKFPNRADAVECNIFYFGAYNLCSALEQYNYSCECRVFQLILHGQVPEGARVDQLEVVYIVHEAYATLEKNEGESAINSKRKGLVSVGGV
ncbi:hypothetical protein THRCLA_08697 [Thraustotheca clavata]|uniref:Translin-associated factor X-interacting protein 1 N-terminal domain-containing protein n=1 Tax=Thraustotheca clavata TaxID=74557 RepID=A0A1V9Z370_9STRA|nr:hypothetical protein THRCLA_08697 [Thraustotheca clavata]